MQGAECAIKPVTYRLVHTDEPYTKLHMDITTTTNNNLILHIFGIHHLRLEHPSSLTTRVLLPHI